MIGRGSANRIGINSSAKTELPTTAIAAANTVEVKSFFIALILSLVSDDILSRVSVTDATEQVLITDLASNQPNLYIPLIRQKCNIMVRLLIGYRLCTTCGNRV